MIRFLLLILWLTAPMLRAEDYPALYDVTGVRADDALNIRERPDADSPIIGMLTPDSTGVEVVAEVDGWGVVNIGERAGYANLRFLARSERPAWNQLATPLVCSGSEPFWRIEIDPANRAAHSGVIRSGIPI